MEFLRQKTTHSTKKERTLHCVYKREGSVELGRVVVGTSAAIHNIQGYGGVRVPQKDKLYFPFVSKIPPEHT